MMSFRKCLCKTKFINVCQINIQKYVLVISRTSIFSPPQSPSFVLKTPDHFLSNNFRFRELPMEACCRWRSCCLLRFMDESLLWNCCCFKKPSRVNEALKVNLYFCLIISIKSKIKKDDLSLHRGYLHDRTDQNLNMLLLVSKGISWFLVKCEYQLLW